MHAKSKMVCGACRGVDCAVKVFYYPEEGDEPDPSASHRPNDTTRTMDTEELKDIAAAAADVPWPDAARCSDTGSVAGKEGLAAPASPGHGNKTGQNDTGAAGGNTTGGGDLTGKTGEGGATRGCTTTRSTAAETVARRMKQKEQRRRAIQRAAAELAICSAINHPCLLQVYDYYTRTRLLKDPTSLLGYRLEVYDKEEHDQLPASARSEMCLAVVMTLCDMGPLDKAIAGRRFMLMSGKANLPVRQTQHEILDASASA